MRVVPIARSKGYIPDWIIRDYEENRCEDVVLIVVFRSVFYASELEKTVKSDYDREIIEIRKDIV